MSRFKARFRCHALAALAAASLVLAGCGGSAAARPRGGAASERFPITLRTPLGRVRLRHRAVRVVSLSPSATEDLFAIGAGQQVVAVDSDSDYPKRAPRTTISFLTPDVEAVAKYRPDLVVISSDTNHVAAALAKVGIPVLLEPAAANLAQLYTEIDQLGRATGRTIEARRVAGRIRRRVAAIIRSTPRPARPLTVYHELDPTYFSATSRTFIGQLYRLLGLRNIADRASGASDYPQLSAEYIIAANPDLIVLADTVCCGQSRATVAARPGWKRIAAVRTGMVIPVNDSIASRWGPRIVRFLGAVSRAVKRLEARR